MREDVSLYHRWSVDDSTTWQISCFSVGMADPLAPFVHQFQRTVLVYGVSAIIIGTFAGLLYRSLANWFTKRLVELVQRRKSTGIAIQDDLMLDAPPCCPRCGNPMVKRVPKKELKKESGFWGCSRYPQCRGTRELVGSPVKPFQPRSTATRFSTPGCGPGIAKKG
jgi:hypothetical protein